MAHFHCFQYHTIFVNAYRLSIVVIYDCQIHPGINCNVCIQISAGYVVFSTSQI